jgi:rod shape-determining protein MreD
VIITPKILGRLALVIVIAVVLQVAFFSKLTIFGTSPNVLPVVAVCLGVLGGAVVGAVCGFAMGLLLDSALLSTLGVSSLVLLTAGYLAGRYRESFDIANPAVPLVLAGSLTALAAVGFALFQLMLGVDAPVSLMVVREFFLQALYGVLLMLPVYPLLRRVLRAALVEEPPRGKIPIPFRAA